MQREKIFVSAYACEPDKGSEIGVGWHWILEMSKQYDLWVLTRANNKNVIENWIDRNSQYKQIHFVYYDLPKKMSWWKRGRKGVRLYYILWQKLSNKIVKNIMQTENIKIYHLLTYGNALWPASTYGMKQFFIWGPTGGTDTIPYDYFKHYGLKGKVIEIVRHFIVKTLWANCGFRKRIKNANIILCKSTFMYRNVPLKYREKAVIFTDVAIDTASESNAKNELSEDNNIIFLAVGKLDAWRGFDLLIEAFAKANDANAKLEIVGDGIDRKRLKRLIRKNNMTNHIILTGELTRDEYFDKMKHADVIINPALKEGGVTVAFDAVKNEKPLICVDTGGYTKCFDKNFVTILERKSRRELIENLVKEINKMINEHRRGKLMKKTGKMPHNITWEEKGGEICKLIEQKIV